MAMASGNDDLGSLFQEVGGSLGWFKQESLDSVVLQLSSRKKTVHSSIIRSHKKTKSKKGTEKYKKTRSALFISEDDTTCSHKASANQHVDGASSSSLSKDTECDNETTNQMIDTHLSLDVSNISISGVSGDRKANQSNHNNLPAEGASLPHLAVASCNHGDKRANHIKDIDISINGVCSPPQSAAKLSKQLNFSPCDSINSSFDSLHITSDNKDGRPNTAGSVHIQNVPDHSDVTKAEEGSDLDSLFKQVGGSLGWFNHESLDSAVLQLSSRKISKSHKKQGKKGTKQKKRVIVDDDDDDDDKATNQIKDAGVSSLGGASSLLSKDTSYNKTATHNINLPVDGDRLHSEDTSCNHGNKTADHTRDIDTSMDGYVSSPLLPDDVSQLQKQLSFSHSDSMDNSSVHTISDNKDGNSNIECPTRADIDEILLKESSSPRNTSKSDHVLNEAEDISVHVEPIDSSSIVEVIDSHAEEVDSPSLGGRAGHKEIDDGFRVLTDIDRLPPVLNLIARLSSKKQQFDGEIFKSVSKKSIMFDRRPFMMTSTFVSDDDNDFIPTPPRVNIKQSNATSVLSSSDDDIENFFTKIRTPCQKKLASKKSIEKFIVNDCDVSSDDDTSFYVNVDSNRTPDLPIPTKTVSSARPRILTERNYRTPVVRAHKPEFQTEFIKRAVTKQPERPRSEGTTRPLTFLASLSMSINSNERRSPDALRFVKKYKVHKQELAERLFSLFDEQVFDNKLQDQLSIKFNKRLLKTAGYCAYKRPRNISDQRTCRIELSDKVCDSTERLRDTVIHEMCHAAVWIISGCNDGHGQLWKAWARKSNQIYPEIPPIKRCHSYDIETKYTYQCTLCGYRIGRHSKSLDTAKKVCGKCHGPFQLLVMNKDGTLGPTPARKVTPFASFVKDNYKDVKTDSPNLPHRDIMKVLSAKFAATKISN